MFWAPATALAWCRGSSGLFLVGGSSKTVRNLGPAQGWTREGVRFLQLCVRRGCLVDPGCFATKTEQF